jgi:hypothetical protein
VSEDKTIINGVQLLMINRGGGGGGGGGGALGLVAGSQPLAAVEEQ